MPTDVLFTPYVYSVDAQALYRITASVQDRGDLPDDGVFVYQIVNKAYPSLDVYSRVSTVSDYVDIERDRVLATVKGSGFYRSATFTKEYSNVRVANTAKELVKDYVNSLVEQYALYLSGFTGTELTAFPLFADSIIEASKAEYLTSADTVTSQEAIIAAKVKECDALAVVLNNLTSERDSLQLTSDTLAGLSGMLTASLSTWSDLFSSGELFADSVNAATVAVTSDKIAGEIKSTASSTLGYMWDPDPTAAGEADEGTVPGLLRDFAIKEQAAKASTTGLRDKSRRLDAQLLTITTRLDLLTGTLVPNAVTSLSDCQESLGAANQTLAGQIVLRDAALAAVVSLCPDYVPPA